MSKKKYVKESFESVRASSNFIAIYWDMFDSKAWKSLNAREIELYIFMRRKYQRKVSRGIIYESNKDDISVPFGEYSEFMQQKTFEKAIDGLIDKGFIYLVENNCHRRQCNIYGFSDMWAKYGTKEFYIKPNHRRTIKQQKEARELERQS